MQQLVRVGQQQQHNRHRGARPLLHQIVLEAVPLAGVRMAPIQFECPVPGSMMRNGRWGGGRGEGVADAGVHLQYFPH